MIRFSFLLLLPFVAQAQRISNNFLDDEMYNNVMSAWEDESRNLQDDEQRILFGNFSGFRQDNLQVGDRCGLANSCAEGLDCIAMGGGVNRRCMPRKDCINEEVERFKKEFDVDAHKKFIFGLANTTQAELINSRKLYDDEMAWIESDMFQRVITVMKENPGDFYKLEAMVDKCTSQEEEFPRRRLNGAPTKAPSRAPSMTPSKAPSFSDNTIFLGLHIEVGLVIDVATTVFWKGGNTGNILWVRGCLGAELGLGAEFSFYFGYAWSGNELDINCGSVNFDADVAVGLAVGVGAGICFTRNPAFAYLDVTVGAGLGIGAGMGICGVVRGPGGPS